MATEIKLPELGEDVDSAKVVNVLVSAGDTVDEDMAVIEVETDKANVEVPAQASGTVGEIKVEVGDELSAGDVILLLEGESREGEPDEARDEAADDGEQGRDTDASRDRGAARAPSAGAREARTASRVEPDEAADADGRIIAAPSTRRVARELGVDLRRVRSTGPGGRILLEDVKRHAADPGPEPDLPDFAQFGEIRHEPLTRVRRRTAEHMRLCWQTIPHVTIYHRADITEVEEIRRAYAGKAEQAGGKLTLTAVLLKIVAAALRAHPRLNSSLDLAGGERGRLVVKRYCNIGVAVDTDEGLVVPVIRDVDRKSVLDLAVEVTGLAERARAGELAPDEVTGGTFTISNLGGLGVGPFTPIVNHPETAILGVGRARPEPVFRDDELERRLILPLALSIDHRALDGADGARFLSWIADALREPLRVAMES